MLDNYAEKNDLNDEEMEIFNEWKKVAHKAISTNPITFNEFLEKFLESSTEEQEDLFHWNKHITEPLLEKLEKEFSLLILSHHFKVDRADEKTPRFYNHPIKKIRLAFYLSNQVCMKKGIIQDDIHETDFDEVWTGKELTEQILEYKKSLNCKEIKK